MTPDAVFGRSIIRLRSAALATLAALLLLGTACPGGGVPMRKIGNPRLGPGCQYDTFSDALLAAQDGDILVVRADRTFTEDAVVRDDIMILGSASQTCLPLRDATGPRPLLRSSWGTTLEIQADVVLVDLRIADGGLSYGDGGNLHVTPDGSALLDHVELRNGLADRGAGIYAEGDVTLSGGTEITGGFANEGGGVYITEASLTLGDVTIAGNETETDGAGIYALDANVSEIAGTVPSIRENFANHDGGGMWIRGGSLVLADAVFASNHAEYEGGGLRVEGATGDVTLGSFTDNDAGSGGGLYATGATITSLGPVSDNSAYFGGGAVLQAGAQLAAPAEFTDNEAIVVGGGVAMYYGATWSTAGSLIGNRAGESGGGALLSGATIDWSGGSGVIEGNQAGAGGGVYFNAITSNALLLGQASVRGNVATGSGGAVFANGSQAGSTVQMTAATELEDNVALAYGGGIAAQGHVQIYLEELKARRNHAGVGGGAVATLLDDTAFAPSLTVINRDDGVAGCLHAPFDPPADAYCVEFRENTAGFDGGALYLEEVTGSVDQAAFVANEAAGRGDAIALSPTGAVSQLQMNSVLFADHVAASEVLLVDSGGELVARHLSAGDNTGVPIRWNAGASGSLRNSAIADTAIVVDAAVGVLAAGCNAVFAAPTGGGSLGGSFDAGFTTADFAVDGDRGRFQVDPGNGFLLDRCTTGGATDIDEALRDAMPDRGAFERGAAAVAVVPAKP